MSTLQERMAEAKKHYESITGKNFKNTELADYVGVSKVNVGLWFKGPTKELEGSNLLKAAEFLRVSSKWLAGERAPMLSDKVDTSFTNVVINESSLRRIPILDFVQAGLFYEAGYDGINPKGETYTTYIGCKPESVFSLEVSGLSMSPEFAPGDKLVVDAAKEPYPGCYVIAQNGSHEATFKKYRAIGYDEHGRETFELVPLNPDFPIMNSTQQEIRIIGVVVEHLRSFGK